MIGAEIVKAGANARGLRLIGDKFIGYRFVPRGEDAEIADALLGYALDDYSGVVDWLHENRDGEYAAEAWNSTK